MGIEKHFPFAVNANFGVFRKGKIKKRKITKPTARTECEYSTLCPALGKCRISGIFTRYNTNNCICRDLMKEKKPWKIM